MKPPVNMNTGDMIKFCLVRAVAKIRDRWKVKASSGGMLNSKENPKIVIEKPHFFYQLFSVDHVLTKSGFVWHSRISLWCRKTNVVFYTTFEDRPHRLCTLYLP
jgi:hypothetical protein